MKSFRPFLVAGFIAVISSAAHRARARDPGVDVELDGYGGTSTGGWLCGPVGRARYAGAGAGVQISEHPSASEDREGAFAAIDGTADYERVNVAPGPCAFPVCTPGDPPPVSPPSRTLYGARARVGFRSTTFSLQGGVIGFQAWAGNEDKVPSLGWFPQFELGVGDGHKLHGVVGLGSPFVTGLRRPGAYVGGGYTWSSRLGLDVRAGLFRSGPSFDEATARADLVGRVRLAEPMWLRVGAAAAEPNPTATTARLDYELSVGTLLSF